MIINDKKIIQISYFGKLYLYTRKYKISYSHIKYSCFHKLRKYNSIISLLADENNSKRKMDKNIRSSVPKIMFYNL